MDFDQIKNLLDKQIAECRETFVGRLISDKGDEGSDYLRGSIRTLDLVSGMLAELRKQLLAADDAKSAPVPSRTLRSNMKVVA